MKKNKVNLSDYDYLKDIENRITMSSFSTFEVDALREILHSSVKIPIKELVSQLHVTLEKLLPALEKFKETGLLFYDERLIIVDKEMRKYYELQIDKFDDDFHPDITFLQGLLCKVPIHILPSWYSIPRMTDNIIASIIEKNLQTPKIYRRYLNELHFEDPILQSIMEDVFKAPNFKIRSRDLREKYSLSRKQLEEYLLFLEFNFVCFLSYLRVDGMWKEVVTPFYEWREYSQFERDSIPPSIENPDEIIRRHSQNFGFIEEMERLIKIAQKCPIPVKYTKGRFVSPPKILKNLKISTSEDSRKEYSKIIEKLVALQMAEVANEELSLLSPAQEWQRQPIFDKAMTIYRHPLNKLDHKNLDPKFFTERDFHLAEKTLKRIISCDWIYFDDFLKSVIEPIGSASSPFLKKIGRRRWKYVLPTYTEEEQEFIRRVIFERLYEVGIVATGTHQGRLCFSLTPFGKMALGE